MNETRIVIDNDGLLFLLTALKSKFALTVHEHGVASQTEAGFLSASDKKKLDSISENAAAVEISTVIDASSTDLTAASSKAVREYVKKALTDITGFTGEIAESLPETGKANVIYLIPKPEAGEGNGYDEYMWINGAFELLGSTNIDLSGYLKTADLRPMTNEEIESVFEAAGL